MLIYLRQWHCSLISSFSLWQDLNWINLDYFLNWICLVLHWMSMSQPPKRLECSREKRTSCLVGRPFLKLDFFCWQNIVWYILTLEMAVLDSHDNRPYFKKNTLFYEWEKMVYVSLSMNILLAFWSDMVTTFTYNNTSENFHINMITLKH